MMKNKSFKYPFPLVGDGNFDHNKDGQLDFFETMQRDAQIEFDEQFRNKNTEYKPKKVSLLSCDFEEQKPQMKNETKQQSFPLLFFAIIVLIGGLVLTFTSNIGDLVRLIILFGSLGLGIFLLKIGSWYK